MIARADAVRFPLPDKSVDLVFGSPPYCDARTYGINAQRKCADWIDWMLGVTAEAVRVSRGLVLWVCAGVTRDHCYWPACEGLLYRWWAQGGQCWRPAYWHRVGIPGSGGKQWLRADVEYVLAFKGPGLLPFADNTAMGHPPKWAPGGAMSHRVSSGDRRNQWGRHINSTNSAGRRTDGSMQESFRPSHRVHTKRKSDGEMENQSYFPPVLANPGNLLRTVVGGNQMGSKLAHDNEAPFPEKLAEFFVRSWCPPDGLVCDPFSGSGTTIRVAQNHGRRGIGFDLRQSQCELGVRRLAEVVAPPKKKKVKKIVVSPDAGYPVLPGLFD